MKSPDQRSLKPGIVHKTIIIALGALILALGVPAYFLSGAVQPSPLVQPPRPLTYEDAVRVRQLLKDNNPRRLQPDEIKDLSLSERDCNLLLYYGLARTFGKQRTFASVRFFRHLAGAKATFVLPHNPLGPFLNIEVLLVPSEKLVDVVYLKIGDLKIPGALVNGIRDALYRYAKSDPRLSLFLQGLQSLKGIRFEESYTHLTYQWQPAIIKRITRQGQNLLFSKRDKETFTLYNKAIFELAGASGEKSLPISYFLPPLFRLAKRRSAAGADAVNENRILVLTLGAYCLGKRIHRIIGTEPTDKTDETPLVQVTLNDRADLAKHFVVSAALAASAGTGLANFAGVFKEVSDSKGGSGFSFPDLLADRAGVRIGELAIGSIDKAGWMQEKLSTVQSDADFMPVEDQLPEGLQEKELKQRFEDLDSAIYRQIEAEIDRRIAACPIYTANGH